MSFSQSGVPYKYIQKSLNSKRQIFFKFLEIRPISGQAFYIIIIIGRLKSTIPNLQMYLPEKANSEKVGLKINNPCRIYIYFFEFAYEQVLGEG
jgi:hypothetical protein